MIKRKRIAGLVGRLASVGILVGLLVAGCAADQPCRAGKTGGWLSGWGSGGANAVTLGLHRTWRDCADRTTGPARAPVDAGPVPSADPASEQPMSPSGSSPPR